MRAAAKVSLYMALPALLLAGCLKTEDYPDEPRITDWDFKQFGDSASLVVFFTDGDGDVGLDPSDIQPPFDADSEWYHNLFVEYEELQNGDWVRPSLLLPLYYRIPRLVPTGRNRSLRGDIAVGLQWPVFPGGQYDTVRFQVRMADRALNVSNTIVTDAIKVVP
ncbi:MAG: hypothetical protein KIT10_09300 [Flavobacteriales bacterium]|nr:hypothetical protein [Flavobacteriales bacterium]